MTLFPLTTLIRLYELLKNSRESCDSFIGNANIKASAAIPRWRFDMCIDVVEDDGIEPTTPCLQSRCSPI